MSVKKEAEDILENVQEVVTAKGEAENILGNIQPPLTRQEVDETTVEIARRLTWNRVGFYALGMGVGAITGYFVAKRLLQTKYSKIADDEIEEMRRHYKEKEKALEAQAAKRPVEEIVRERGYSPPEEKDDIPAPMAVKPPPGVPIIGREEETRESETRNIFQQQAPEVDEDFEWDYQEELKRRSPDVPYVIHIDERQEMDYQSETLTYYEGDDVLCHEDDSIVDPDDRDSIVGEGNLYRFGHGSGDPVIVYIRNDKLELIYEVIRSPNKFAEEVHGFSHTEYGGNLERMRKRERDEQEE